MERVPGAWENTVAVFAHTYTCAFCGCGVGSDRGWQVGGWTDRCYIRICPMCNRPTFFETTKSLQVPAAAFGNSVAELPKDVQALYDEARRCTSASGYTAAVMACRTILMYIAVERNAPIGQTFKQYVDYLHAHHYTPPNSAAWVDHIRDRGSEANHEIKLMTADDAKEVITFVEMLLKFIYEFPRKVPVKGTSAVPAKP